MFGLCRFASATTPKTICNTMLTRQFSVEITGTWTPCKRKAFCRQPAPSFTVDALMPDMNIKPVSLSDYRDKWMVLFFYPKDFTFICPTEIIEFSEKAAEFEKVGCSVVGASTDSPEVHFAWCETPRTKGGLGKLAIPLLSDMTHQLALDYGCYQGDCGHTTRATYIIDNKGVIRHIQENDMPVGRNVDELLRLVQGYQFHEKHGEVCPANWTPGAATIDPSPRGKLSFFENAGL